MLFSIRYCIVFIILGSFLQVIYIDGSIVITNFFKSSKAPYIYLIHNHRHIIHIPWYTKLYSSAFIKIKIQYNIIKIV